MEKHAKPKTNILKFLPKAASAVTFQNLPFSPGREKRSDIHINKLKAHAGRGFSGPIISIIPDEARRKSKNDSFDNQEPTSPKVSCMGQIKKHKANHKKKMNHMKKASLPKDTKPAVSSPREVKKQPSKFRRLFSGIKPARKSDVSDDHDQKLPDRAPALSQMKRFASGHTRDAFSNFDWTAHQIAPLDSDHRNYYSDEERGDSDQEEEEDFIIPFSAPMTVGGGGVALQPRKEVNLWKRRTMNPPRPLQLNPMVDEVH